MEFVSSLLVYDPEKRLSAADAINHPWLKKTQFGKTEGDSKAQEAALHESVRDNILNYAKMSEFKRIAAVVVAHKSSTAEIVEMRKAFDKYDKKKDGVISMEEFKLALSEFNYTDEELSNIFSRMVRDNVFLFEALDRCTIPHFSFLLRLPQRMSIALASYCTQSFWRQRWKCMGGWKVRHDFIPVVFCLAIDKYSHTQLHLYLIRLYNT